MTRRKFIAQKIARRYVEEVSDSSGARYVCERLLMPKLDIGGGIGAAIVRDRSDCIGLIGGGRFPKYLPNQVYLTAYHRKVL